MKWMAVLFSAVVFATSSAAITIGTCGGTVALESERRAGSLLGLVYGDAFGALVEYWTPEEIRAVFGKYRAIPNEVPTKVILEKLGNKRLGWVRPLGLYTDDGAQALALLRVALGKPGWTADHRFHWRSLIVDGFHFGSWRGIGKMFAQAGKRMADTAIADGDTGSDSAGIGAAMRIGPYGALYADDDVLLERAVVESTLMTHADIRAAAIAFATARAVAWIVKGRNADEVRRELPSAVRAMEERWLADSPQWRFNKNFPHQVSDALREVLHAKAEREELPALVMRVGKKISGVAVTSPNDPFCLYGGVFALAMALEEGNPQQLLSDIVHQGADTDTVAAIAGSVLGARYGTDWIALERLQQRPMLEEYAKALTMGVQPPDDDAVFLLRERELTVFSDAFGASLRP